MGIQELIVVLIVLVSIAFVVRKYVFKPKTPQKKSCNSGCDKCGGCG